MKENVNMEYNSVSKRYEVLVNGDKIGQIYKSHNVYQTYFKDDYIGDFSNPYSGKEEILNKYYPTRKTDKEKAKATREELRAEKEKQKQIKADQELRKHKETLQKMNMIRNNECFRNCFYEYFIKLNPEYANLTKEEVFQGARIGMNSIALVMIDGETAINKAIKRNDYEGKMLKLYQENNVIEQILKLINIAR